ncbi:MAG: hypothetical protein WAZ12_04720 [Candidatus Absconditicoccaceae bacterium]
MKKFDKFIIKSSEFDKKSLKAIFNFSFDDDIFFVEEIDFTCKGFVIEKNIDQDVIDGLVFHMSIALAISYYKLCPTREIIIENGFIDDRQKEFWRKFYINGLGEYFFRNKISPLDLCYFVNSDNKIKEYKKININSQKALVTLGGGKDSLFVSHIFGDIGLKFDTCTFGKDYILHQSVGDKIGVPRLLITRQMDNKLFDMNQQGYYNGHVPITGIIAFVLEMAAYLYDYNYIVLANEKSSNEPNTYMDGIAINHQYSKSFEFEKDLDRYVNNYISSDVKYFSLLRGMYEILIARDFIKYGKYFDVFSSCNNNFKIIEQNKTTKDRRCCKCPKCAFVYSIFRPFITDEQVNIIFGKELYDAVDLDNLFRELLGVSGIKPFECVGTNEEVVLAMYMYYKKLKKDSMEIPIILKTFEKEILTNMIESEFIDLENKLFNLYTDEDLIPKNIKSKLLTWYKNNG